MRFPFFILLLLSLPARAQVLPARQQAEVVDEVLADRVNRLLPALMRETGIDMWVLISREYNEDPVLKTFLPATWLSARRRTMLVFYHDSARGIFDRLAVARYNVGATIQSAWNPEQQPDQWAALTDIISARNPKKIGINLSENFGHADGLTHTEWGELTRRLPASLKSRLVSAETLAVRWLETRTERELELYPSMVALTHRIIEEAFSDRVVIPGVTTTDDVVWWMRDRFRALGLDTWFQPSVDVQRSDAQSFGHLRSFANRPADQVIMPGDLLHCDVGITYLRLNTDIQQHAYVLRTGETALPQSLARAMAAANRLQDLLTAEFRNGRTGNQILAGALAAAKAEGIKPSIYTHPLGLHGHAAGPTIGLWDQQAGVAGSGDYPLYPRTVYSIELNAATEVPEWKKDVRIMLEEDGYWDGQTFRYLHGRQTKMHLIRSTVKE